MKRNKKALLWVLALFLALAVSLYIGGCGGGEEAKDTGKTEDVVLGEDIVTSEDSGPINPCDGKKEGDVCTGGYCVEKVGGGLECAKSCTELGIDTKCGIGYGCYPLKDKKVCLEAGSKKDGEICGAINACEAGYICYKLINVYECLKICSKNEDCSGASCDVLVGDGFTTKVCSKISDPCEGKTAGDACTGGYCIAKVGGGLECAKSCTKVGIDPVCGSEYGCYPYGNKKVCLKSGSRSAGDSCGAINDCEAGTVCLDGGSGYVCWLVCYQSSDCPKGSSCTSVEDADFGACVYD